MKHDVDGVKRSRFIVRATPHLVQWDDDDPRTRFIDINHPVLDAEWLLLGHNFAVAWETGTLADALSYLDRRFGGWISLRQARSDPSLCYGRLFFEQRTPTTRHVEYQTDFIRGAKTPAPTPDAAVEKALRQWLRGNKLEVCAVVANRAGELR